MLTKKLEEKIDRRAALVAKKVDKGLTLSEAYELQLLDRDLSGIPLVSISEALYSGVDDE
jgi:hypothetical protein